MRRLGLRCLKVLVGTLLLAVLLIVVPRAAVQASTTYIAEHQFAFEVPNGWTIQLHAGDHYNEPDLLALAQTDDKLQEINVYREFSTSYETTLDYLQGKFRAAASNPDKANIQVLTQPREARVPNAGSGAYGAYAYTDKGGIRQVVMQLVAATDSDTLLSDIYELNVLPTQSYAGQYPNELQAVLDSFKLLP